MPIYAYRCEACGFAKDVLQKMSDAPLTECTACGKPAFKKQLTAAGFQLKGSGWYATDFKSPVKPKLDKATGANSEAVSAPTATSTPAPDTATAVTKEASPASTNQ